MIKNQISALMDGELDDDEARVVFGRLKQNKEARDEWQIYHLIGDSLRQTPAAWEDGFSARFAEKFAAEPTVLAPSRQQKIRRSVVALSIAASLAAISLVTWTAFQLNQPEAPKITDGEVPHDVSRYLVAHQEYYATPMGAALPGDPPYLSASLERQQKSK